MLSFGPKESEIVSTLVTFYGDIADLVPPPTLPAVAGGSRLLTRLIPVVGTAVLAYEVYRAYGAWQMIFNGWIPVGSACSSLPANGWVSSTSTAVCGTHNDCTTPIPASFYNMGKQSNDTFIMLRNNGGTPFNGLCWPLRSVQKYQKLVAGFRAPPQVMFIPSYFPEELPGVRYPAPQGDPNEPTPWPAPFWWPDDPAMPDPAAPPEPSRHPHPVPIHTPAPLPWVHVPPLIEIEHVPRPQPRPSPSPSPQPGPGTGPGPSSPPSPATGLGPPTAAAEPAASRLRYRHGGKLPPNHSRPSRGIRERKYRLRGVANALHLLDALSEGAELIDCLYQAMPEVQSRALAREAYAGKMNRFWADYRAAKKAGQLESASDRARFLNRKPRYDRAWDDPNKDALNADKTYSKHVPEQYSWEGAQIKLPYLWQHIGDISPDVLSSALACGIYNQFIEDKAVGRAMSYKSRLHDLTRNPARHFPRR